MSFRRLVKPIYASSHRLSYRLLHSTPTFRNPRYVWRTAAEEENFQNAIKNCTSRALTETQSGPHGIISFMIMRELENVNIRFTSVGRILLRRVCARVPVVEFIANPGNCEYEIANMMIMEEIINGDDESIYEHLYENSMISLGESPYNLWRSRHVETRYEQYKVFMLWETLFHRSSFFRVWINSSEIERYDGSDETRDSPLWYLLWYLYEFHLIIPEDVDKLPDPIVYTLGPNAIARKLGIRRRKSRHDI